jgi:hypothetical protein
MNTNSRNLQYYVVLGHPYVFDAMFSSFVAENGWSGAGRVVVQSKGGGVNQAWALVEADREGCEGLIAAGFSLRDAGKKFSAGKKFFDVAGKKRKSPDGHTTKRRTGKGARNR